jgi:hypothetical protein
MEPDCEKEETEIVEELTFRIAGQRLTSKT